MGQEEPGLEGWWEVGGRYWGVGRLGTGDFGTWGECDWDWDWECSLSLSLVYLWAPLAEKECESARV